MKLSNKSRQVVDVHKKMKQKWLILILSIMLCVNNKKKKKKKERTPP